MFDSEDFESAYSSFLHDQNEGDKRTRREKTINIKVYCGGMKSYQVDLFQDAVRQLASDDSRNLSTWTICNRIVNFDYLYAAEIRKLDWGPEQMITWLLESDIHVILCHVHQSNGDWNIQEIMHNLDRLKNHTGFPSGDSLRCPAFTQDKYEYIAALMVPSTEDEEDFALKTWKQYETYRNEDSREYGNLCLDDSVDNNSIGHDTIDSFDDDTVDSFENANHCIEKIGNDAEDSVHLDVDVDRANSCAVNSNDTAPTENIDHDAEDSVHLDVDVDVDRANSCAVNGNDTAPTKNIDSVYHNVNVDNTKQNGLVRDEGRLEDLRDNFYDKPELRKLQAIPTLKVTFPLVNFPNYDFGQIMLFCKNEGKEDVDGFGWVVKCPFVTNSTSMTWCRTFVQVYTGAL